MPIEWVSLSCVPEFDRTPRVVTVRWPAPVEYMLAARADSEQPATLPPPAEPQPRPKTLLERAEAVWPARMTKPEAIRWCTEELGLKTRPALGEYQALPRKFRYVRGERAK
jgi:hypothetical protein